MSLKYITGKFSILFISLIYFVFSCCYVTRCQRTNSLFIFGHSSHNALHVAKRQNRTFKHSDIGKFPTRPRVIEHNNKISSGFIAIIVLSCLFLGFNNRKEYYFPFIVYFKRLYSPNLILSLGSFRI